LTAPLIESGSFHGLLSSAAETRRYRSTLANADSVLGTIEERWPAAYDDLKPTYYDAHAMMATVLEDLYGHGKLSIAGRLAAGSPLARSDGPCTFCVNDEWQFPQGCPYDKPSEAKYPAGYLKQVASQVIAHAPELRAPAELLFEDLSRKSPDQL